MKTKNMLIVVMAYVVVSLIQTGCNSDKQETPAQRPSPEPREVWGFVSVTATVEAVDLQRRELTLRGPRGNVLTLDVDERVRRLNEIEVGDHVTAGYYISLATEIREPTPEEKEAPLTVVAGAAKAPPGTSPAAGGLQRIKAIVTVENIDHVAQTVTVKGPLGNYLTVRVLDPDRLQKLRLGDTVIVTYTEALAVSVEKAK